MNKKMISDTVDAILAAGLAPYATRDEVAEIAPELDEWEAGCVLGMLLALESNDREVVNAVWL